MIGYASRTGTRRNLAALRAAGWRLLVSARGVVRTEGFRYALDNGAWTAHKQGRAFDAPAFERALSAIGSDADFVIAPDIVAGGLESLRFSVAWLDRLTHCRRVLIAAQDGMTPADVAPYLTSRIGVAIGGSTEWKIEQLTRRAWRASWGHVLRVNTARRISLCHYAGADSFDGSGPSRFASELPRLDRARRQGALPWS